MKKFLAALFFQSFILNFVWEVTQMPLYLPAGMGERVDYPVFLGIHWQVALFDAMTVVVAYLLVGLVLRNVRWGASNEKGAWAFLVSGLVIWQISVEYLAVYVYHRWAYAPAMPLISGIGISPLIQMAFLAPLAILLSRHLLARKNLQQA